MGMFGAVGLCSVRACCRRWFAGVRPRRNVGNFGRNGVSRFCDAVVVQLWSWAPLSRFKLSFVVVSSTQKRLQANNDGALCLIAVTAERRCVHRSKQLCADRSLRPSAPSLVNLDGCLRVLDPEVSGHPGNTK